MQLSLALEHSSFFSKKPATPVAPNTTAVDVEPPREPPARTTARTTNEKMTAIAGLIHARFKLARAPSVLGSRAEPPSISLAGLSQSSCCTSEAEAPAMAFTRQLLLGAELA